MHRHSLLLTVLAGTLLLGNCSLLGSDGNGKLQADSTYFRATLNGESWSGSPDGSLVDIGGFDWVGIEGDTTHRNRFPYRENLLLQAEYKGIGKYPLTRTVRNLEFRSMTTGSSYYEVDGDVIISRYQPIDDTSTNQLTITSYDTTTGIMEGTFRTTVVVDSADRESEPGEPPRRRPDTLRFTDGEFRVKVEDRRDQ